MCVACVFETIRLFGSSTKKASLRSLPCTRIGCSAAPASRKRHKCSQAHLEIVFKVFSPSVADAREHARRRSGGERLSQRTACHIPVLQGHCTLPAYLLRAAARRREKAIDGGFSGSPGRRGTLLCRFTSILSLCGQCSDTDMRTHTSKYAAGAATLLVSSCDGPFLFKFLKFKKAEWFLCTQYLFLP